MRSRRIAASLAASAALFSLTLVGSPASASVYDYGAGGVHLSSEYEHINRGGDQYRFWSWNPCNTGQSAGWADLGSSTANNKITSFETWSYCQNDHYDLHNLDGSGRRSGYWGGYQPYIGNMNGMNDLTSSIIWS
ncbi:hypothetical protein [Yinghuangia seranimata]|uniref:hypothetical protein n=1 Tax=Yinghuangia seranimata TaxID=408067 RepID=UPI00248C7FFB|nr:hypothetical protein [Yinghuangia seranimata]MDI2129203.1 hypothetical protein [Yinghuangia seranimata]